MTGAFDRRGVASATVLICTRDRPGLLLDTVRSVLDGAVVPSELLVVDQSGVPNTEVAGMASVDSCDVRYLQTNTVGLSRARNIGLCNAANDVVVMIDDDVLAEHTWLPNLLGGLPDGTHGVATGRVLAAPPEGRGGVLPPAALVTRDAPADYEGPQVLDVIPGANVAVPRALVLALGGYDERLGAGTSFGAAEDNDMGHRLLLAGCKVHHVPEAVILHRSWRASGELARLRWRYGRGKGAFYAKHIGLGDTFILRRAVADMRLRLRRAGAGLVSSPRGTAAELLSLTAIVVGALDWLVRERISARWGAPPRSSAPAGADRRRGRE